MNARMTKLELKKVMTLILVKYVNLEANIMSTLLQEGWWRQISKVAIVKWKSIPTKISYSIKQGVPKMKLKLVN